MHAWESATHDRHTYSKMMCFRAKMGLVCGVGDAGDACKDAGGHAADFASDMKTVFWIQLVYASTMPTSLMPSCQAPLILSATHYQVILV
jgi:hypothetical protein